MKRLLAVAPALLMAGCGGGRSAFEPAGPEAARIDLLFWIMTGAGTAILLAVLLAALGALRGSPRLRRLLAGERFVLGAGLVLPLAVLSLLLVAALLLLATRADGEAEGQPVFADVGGEQWWWRVTYRLPDGGTLASANELRIPVGRPVRLALTTADVLHSFWIPSLAGKLDMVPGRTNWLTLEASRPGLYGGQCAEFCGGAHALMAFHVVAMPAAEFDAWLAAQAAPVPPPREGEAAAGAALFQTVGCGGCHAVRGTGAAGTIGPDLSRVGGRVALASGTLRNDAAAFARWLREGRHLKPENRMPDYDLLSEAEIRALALYLDSLE